MFDVVLKRVSQRPKSITIDLEPAVANVVKRQLPMTSTLGLQQSFLDDHDVRHYLRNFACLSLVPEQLVIEEFEKLQANSPDSINDFIDYNEDNLIGRPVQNNRRRTPRFAISMWSCFSRLDQKLPRTNNSSEGWHRAIQHSARQHPSIYESIKYRFYQITTSKPILKRILQSKSVPTSDFKEMDQNNPDKSMNEAEKLLSYPMIIKPSISYASLHISNQSVVNNRQEALTQIETMFKLTDKGVFIEKYLAGHEYTVLVAGNERNGIEVFPVLERIFDTKLHLNERLLAFETYWSGYQCNGYGIQGEKLYHSAPVKCQEQIQTIARNAYIALNGNGYARIDIRTDDVNNPNIYVLEVNANCSLGFGDTTPVGEILNMSPYTPSKFVHYLIHLAFNRRLKETNQSHD